MKSEGKRVFIIAMAAALVLSLSGLSTVIAEDKAADNMHILRDKIKADKKLVVAETMDLTDTEAKAFWPVYEDYQKDLGKIYNRMITLIRDYTKNYKSMTSEAAKDLTEEFLAIHAEHQKLRVSYLPRFRKALGDVKVARYYQMENKIDAAMKYELAANIPLME